MQSHATTTRAVWTSSDPLPRDWSTNSPHRPESVPSTSAVVGARRRSCSPREWGRRGPSWGWTSATVCSPTPGRPSTNRIFVVDLQVGDASEPALPAGEFDVVAASLVLFFLPEPLAALARWVQLLAPDGRIGLATFGDQDPAWKSVDEEFGPWLPPMMRDPRVMGPQSPFGSDEGMEQLLEDAGATDVETTTLRLAVQFGTLERWEAFSRGTASGPCGPTCLRVRCRVCAPVPQRTSAGRARPRARSRCGRRSDTPSGAVPETEYWPRAVTAGSIRSEP